MAEVPEIAKIMAKPVPSRVEAERIPPKTTSLTQFDSPQGFFDRAPDSNLFFNERGPRTGAKLSKPSTAKAEKKFKGVHSQDPILDDNTDELWRFLMSNLERPKFFVRLIGKHDSHYTYDVRSSVIIDFDVQIDVSKYVVDWSRIVARRSSKYKYFPSDEGKVGPTLRETLDEYTRSKNAFKEFRLDKRVLWHRNRITNLLKDLVRSSGYQGTVKVEFTGCNHKVAALASNRSSKAVHSCTVRALCVVSCLWIIGWPAWCIARKRVDRLCCEYGMAVSEDEFFSRNYAIFQSAVAQRRRVKAVAL